MLPVKKICLFLLIVVLLLSVAGCGLGGKTLYLPERVEVYFDGELGKTVTYQYGEDGFLTGFLTSNGENSATTAITCDENGNVLSRYMDQPLEASLLFGLAYHYTYSTRGNLLSEIRTINGQMQNQTNWEYNSKHQVTNAAHKDNIGNTVTYLYEYDEDGKLLTITGYREDKQVSETTFEYDEKGRMILETLRNDRGTEVSKVEYRYEDGKTVAEFTTNLGTQGMMITYIFDHAGNILETTYGESGDNIRYAYTYKEVKVSKDSPRRSYTGLQGLPATGLTTLWS